MRRRLAILAAIIAPIVAALGCGYPDFSFGRTGSGSGGGSTASASGTGGAATTTTTSSSAAGTGGATAASSTVSSSVASSTSASSGSPACAIGHLLISEVRTRGPGGAGDEFVELYNATSQEVLLDSFWIIEGRAVDPAVGSYTLRWHGNAVMVPPYGHYLITGNTAAYSGPIGDATFSTGITDGASLRLVHNGGVVDAICYYHQGDGAMATSFVDLLNPYTCEGFPAPNPHDGSSGTDSDVSLERPPGGTLGNCSDGGNNFTDFQMQSPSTPLTTFDAPTP